MNNSFLSAVDNHNVANGDQSWFEKKIDSAIDLVSGVANAATYGTTGAVVSGINSILNSGIAVANFVGAEIEPISNYAVMKSLDDDLANYYKKNESGVDLAGFVLGSFIPGTAGIKALTAARAGTFGTNVSKATGLMHSMQKEYATAAKMEFAAGNSPFSIFNQNVIKSLGAGFGAQALEAGAFEIAVAATMFESPVLDKQSAGNLASNIGIGILIGGGVGGLLHGVGTVYGIKKAGATIDRELFPVKHIEELDELAGSDMKIINYFNQKLNMPEASNVDDYGSMAWAKGETSVLSAPDRLKLVTQEREKTLERLDVLIRQEFNNFAKGDEKVGQQLYERFKDQKDIHDVIAGLVNSKSASRITAEERLVVGDVLFPSHGLKREEFIEAIGKKDYTKLLNNTATANTQGFRITGNLDELKIAGAKTQVGESGVVYDNKDSAFAAGYDLYRNSNGQFSVNPGSKILSASNERRLPNNLVVDFEQNGAIVDKATPGLADLATKANPIKVMGDVVVAGELKPLNVGTSSSFDPLADDYLAIQARYIWAQHQNNINWKNVRIAENDLPLLERAYYDQVQEYRIQKADGTVIAGPTGERLGNYIFQKKTEFAQKLDGKPIDEMELRLNISSKWLKDGENVELAKLRPGVDFNNPRYARIDYPDTINAMDNYNAAYVDGAVFYEQQKIVIQQRHLQNFNNYAGKSGIDFPDAPNWSDPGRTPTREGAGASLAGFANSNFGTAGGWAQFIGTLTNRLKIYNKTETVKTLNDVAASVSTQELRAELDLITNKLRGTPDSWVWSPKAPNSLIMKKELTNVLKGLGEPSESIQMSKEVAEFLKAHNQIAMGRQVHVRNMKGTAGVMDDTDFDTVYAPPINTSKYKHFVFVEPRGFTVGDKKRMIVAKDEETLNKLIAQVDQQQFKIWTKVEKEEWHKAIGDYDFQLGLNESLVDSTLKRKGTLSEHFAGNPSERILDDYLDWHIRQEEMLATRMVEHRYSQSFQELQHLGDRYTNIATSQFRSLTEALVERVKDPYQDVIKTALDISRASEYQWWKSFNESVRSAIEAPSRALGNIFEKSPKVDDAFVESVNKKSQELGLGTPFRDAYSALAASGNIADKPFLAKYIAKAQALMSTTLLQLDPFNAMNNIISTPILLSAETKFLLGAIQRGDATVAGKLSQLMSVATPEVAGSASVVMPSVQRLLRNSVENYRRDAIEGLGLLQRYQKIGAVTDVLQQERQMLQDLTVDFGKLTSASADSTLQKAVESGRKLTGNRLAEEMTRFVSADVMRQITDLALESGVLRSVKEADEYIQLFVNKVQGNYLHSQRPIVFQGVVGQAVSLFQTYQFNLMQQLFKYVGNGDKKSLAMLMGLQGSIYGTQGLPAFNFLNTHIVGNAAGNTEHRDLHFAANSVFGKQVGDWMMYGAGSNALGLIDPSLKINIYSRGDINPRQITVLPTTIEDIPVVNASVRFVKNLWQAGEKLANGALLWPTLSQAIEHNGLSRPLAGLAQTIQGYTTTNQGSLLTASQDFYNIATVSRIAGGKPFDESIALDALYRVNAYRAKDLARIQEVGSALKTHMIAGGIPNEQDVTDFAVKYAKSGGRIENFSKFMTGQMLGANRSQVNKVAEALNSPYANQMQIIMGGVPVPDFQNQKSKPSQTE